MISSIITTFIKQRECLGGKPNLIAYKDSANIWTIGYGQNLFYTSDQSRVNTDSNYKLAKTLEDLPKDLQQWSMQKCEDAFNDHILQKSQILNKYGFNNIVDEFKYGALLDFIFQFGDRPQFFNYIKDNYKNNEAVINKFFEYSKQRINGQLAYVPGILKRRNLELSELWFKNDSIGKSLVENIYKRIV